MSDTNELPKALRLANWLRGCVQDMDMHDAAADELERLHAECEVLRSAAPTAPAAGPQQAAAWLARDGAGQLFIVNGDGPHDVYGGFPVFDRPAPAVERGVADSLERLTRSAENLLNTCPDIDDGTTRCVQNLWASIAASRATLTATGAAQGDKVPEPDLRGVDVFEANEVRGFVARGALKASDELLLLRDLPKVIERSRSSTVQQEAPAAQPLTDEQITQGALTDGIAVFATLASAYKGGVRFAERAHGIQPAATKGTT